MTPRIEQRTMKPLLACVLSLVLPLAAADKPAPEDSDTRSTAAATATPNSEIEQLRHMLLEQQRQIDELRRALLDRGPDKGPDKRTTASPQPAEAAEPAEPAMAHASTGEVASTTAVAPPAPSPTPRPTYFPTAATTPSPQATAASESSPLQLKIGDAYITPVGFMDMTSVTRSTNPGSGIGTNFGSIPYGNTQAGSSDGNAVEPAELAHRRAHRRRWSRTSRSWDIGSLTFWGSSAAPPNGGLAVSSNPYVFRLRLYWVDVSKGKFEFLAGQSWSLMTPNRKGISPLPGDLFYSQDIDVNYQVGLVWGRIPGFRGGLSLQQQGGVRRRARKLRAVCRRRKRRQRDHAPAAISAANAVSGAVLGGQVNNGASVISRRGPAPGHHRQAGLRSEQQVPHRNRRRGDHQQDRQSGQHSGFPDQHQGRRRRSGQPELRSCSRTSASSTNNYWSAGGGRYIFGQAPDFIIRADGSLSLVHSGSTVTGFEATVGKTLFYGYYGGVYIGEEPGTRRQRHDHDRIRPDRERRPEPRHPGNHLRHQHHARERPEVGGLNLMFQYSYLQRNPWLVTRHRRPSNAHLSMGFVNLRYTLPGLGPDRSESNRFVTQALVKYKETSYDSKD